LKEDLQDPITVHRIHQLLVPREFTRLDQIVELLFSTAADVRQEDAPGEEEDAEAGRSPGPKFVPVAFHEACIARIQRWLNESLVRESRATFVSPDRSLGVVCAVSRAHDWTNGPGYWFAFHPHQKESLESFTRAYVAFGCGSADQLLLIPFAAFSKWLEGMNVTQRPDRMYWHVKIAEEHERFTLLRRAGTSRVDLTPYRLAPIAATSG
jgi:hypothetical protein